LKENSRSIFSHKVNTRKRILFHRSSGTIFGEQRKRNMATTNVEHTADKVMIPSLEILQDVLAVAVDASRAAGAIIREHAGGAQVSERKANSRDLLTLVDPLCEKTIKEKVMETFPHHEFLGEEMVAPGADASRAALDLALNNTEADWLWIVDPIDGTTNFVHGMPLCMPSVAVAYQGLVVVGVIYDPHRDELFSAIRGQGAYLNQERRIKVGLQDTIGDAVVAMGSPPGIESLQMSLRGVAALMPKVRTIRMLGSAALMLAWVACGRYVIII
jgi:myo-inositol-1(or 4)-monophosphatase